MRLVDCMRHRYGPSTPPSHASNCLLSSALDGSIKNTDRAVLFCNVEWPAVRHRKSIAYIRAACDVGADGYGYCNKTAKQKVNRRAHGKATPTVIFFIWHRERRSCVFSFYRRVSIFWVTNPTQNNHLRSCVFSFYRRVSIIWVTNPTQNNHLQSYHPASGIIFPFLSVSRLRIFVAMLQIQLNLFMQWLNLIEEKKWTHLDHLII